MKITIDLNEFTYFRQKKMNKTEEEEKKERYTRQCIYTIQTHAKYVQVIRRSETYESKYQQHIHVVARLTVLRY